MTACELCRGACCESEVYHFTGNPVIDQYRRARYKTIKVDGVECYEIEQPCKSLCPGTGKCGIYPQRPTVCKCYAVGSAACVSTVKRRRPKQAAAILALLGS